MGPDGAAPGKRVSGWTRLIAIVASSHPQRSGCRRSRRAEHEQDPPERGPDEEADPFARAGGDVGCHELGGRSGQPRDDRVLERPDRRRGHSVDGRDDQDDGERRPEGEGDRGCDRGGERGGIDPQEHAGPRMPVAQRRGERDPDQGRQRASDAEDPDSYGSSSPVGVHQEGDDERPLRGDRQGPGGFELAEVGIEQDPADRLQ